MSAQVCPRCGNQHVLPCDPAEQRDPLWVDNAIALYGIREARRARAKAAALVVKRER